MKERRFERERAHRRKKEKKGTEIKTKYSTLEYNCISLLVNFGNSYHLLHLLHVSLNANKVRQNCRTHEK